MNAKIKLEKIAVVFVAAVVWAVCCSGAPYVILKNGQRREGVGIRKMTNGDIVLTLADGNRLPFSPNQVEKAVADKPAYFDQAVAALRAGKADIAVEGFEKVVDDYRGLEWDLRAMPYLAQAYTAQGSYLKAERTFDDLFKTNPSLRENTDLNITYAEVLLKANKMSKLEQQLEKMMAEGDRKAAAAAQLIRGNIEMDKQDYKAAAKDYLRTVYFFRNQTDVMPEATFKLAEALEKLRDKRAQEWYSKVVANYPGSEYASRARAKL